MVIASPRAAFRGLSVVPTDWENSKDHLRLIANALRQLQEFSRKHPMEVVSASAAYTMVDIDLLILADATSAAFTVTLLTAAGREGRRIIVKKTDASENIVTIDAAGSETLDGATTVGLTQKNAVREYVSDGTNWRLISAIGNANQL